MAAMRRQPVELLLVEGILNPCAFLRWEWLASSRAQARATLEHSLNPLAKTQQVGNRESRHNVLETGELGAATEVRKEKSRSITSETYIQVSEHGPRTYSSTTDIFQRSLYILPL